MPVISQKPMAPSVAIGGGTGSDVHAGGNPLPDSRELAVAGTHPAVESRPGLGRHRRAVPRAHIHGLRLSGIRQRTHVERPGELHPHGHGDAPSRHRTLLLRRAAERVLPEPENPQEHQGRGRLHGPHDHGREPDRPSSSRWATRRFRTRTTSSRRRSFSSRGRKGLPRSPPTTGSESRRGPAPRPGDISRPIYKWSNPNHLIVDASIVACNDHLLRAMRGEVQAETPGEDNVKTIRLVWACYESARERQGRPPEMRSHEVTAHWHRRIRDAYKSAIGKRRNELVTPALILDLDVARRNIDFMMAEAQGAARPNFARTSRGRNAWSWRSLQLDAGAMGICTATVWEALVMEPRRN